MANLVGYARISSDSQKDNTSLASQRSEIMKYCVKHEHELIGFYEDVESAATLDKRDGLQWAIKTVESAADGLIVYRLDRLSRRVLDAVTLKRKFMESGKLLISVVEPIETEHEASDFMYTVTMAVSEFERKRINKRCQQGQRAKKEAGGYYSGRPPYGYASYKGTLIEIPAEQEVIQLVTRLYFKENYTFTGIAAYLNNAGVPSKTGKKWYLQAIRRIINEENLLLERLDGKILPAEAWTGTKLGRLSQDQQRGQDQ